MHQPQPPSPHDEFGRVEAVESRRITQQGALRPILCRCNDGELYVVKPYSSGGCWPQVMEWVCARLGRKLGLPIPNYRQVFITPRFAEAWNATGARYIEPGLGFGSQFNSRTSECDSTLAKNISPEDATRLVAFDWWIRNTDRSFHNPNLLWDHESGRHVLIDHEKAGHYGDSDSFWADHMFAKQSPWITQGLTDEMQAAASFLPEIERELPSEWTTGTDGLDWFVEQLIQRTTETPLKDWRSHE